MPVEVIFTRQRSIAEEIERAIQGAKVSLDAALYRLNNPRLARLLGEAAARGVRVRLMLDRGRYEETPVAQELLAEMRLPFRLHSGRLGRGSKMHHKFAIFDETTLVTGSYNWTLESEKENFENLLVLRDPEPLAIYRGEFEALWKDAEENQKSEIRK